MRRTAANFAAVLIFYGLINLWNRELFESFQKTRRCGSAPNIWHKKTAQTIWAVYGAGDQIRTDYLVITNDVLYLLSYTSVASLRNVLYYNSLCGQLQPLFLKIIIYFNFPVDLIFRLPFHRIRPERLPPPFQLPIDASAKLYHSRMLKFGTNLAIMIDVE